MSRFVLIDGRAYDVDTERSAATRALLVEQEHEARVYEGDPDGEHYATVTVLRDSGMLHQVAS